MKKSNISIIKHVPGFLNYCKVEKRLANKTQENYNHYLSKFVSWLKKAKKEALLPHKLTSEDIWAYRLYLSRHTDKKDRSLKEVSQNYYLIALRAFLGYFVVEDIVSLPPAKITLSKAIKTEKTVKFLTLDQLEKLLLTPNVNIKR